MVCDTTDLYVWHDPFTSVTWHVWWCFAVQLLMAVELQKHQELMKSWLTYMCDMHYAYMWHDSSVCLTGLMVSTWNMCDMPAGDMYATWHDYCAACVTWVLCDMCGMTAVNAVWHVVTVWRACCVTWLLCDMTAGWHVISAWHDCWRLLCDMTCAWHVWHDCCVTAVCQVLCDTTAVWHDCCVTCVAWLLYDSTAVKCDITTGGQVKTSTSDPKLCQYTTILPIACNTLQHTAIHCWRAS